MTWKHAALSTLAVQAYMLGLYTNRLSGNNTVNIMRLNQIIKYQTNIMTK